MWISGPQHCQVKSFAYSEVLRFLQHFERVFKAFQWYQPFVNWNATSKDMRKRWCSFAIIFFIFYKLFCVISPNEPGRHKLYL